MWKFSQLCHFRKMYSLHMSNVTTIWKSFFLINSLYLRKYLRLNSISFILIIVQEVKKRFHQYGFVCREATPHQPMVNDTLGSWNGFFNWKDVFIHAVLIWYIQTHVLVRGLCCNTMSYFFIAWLNKRTERWQENINIVILWSFLKFRDCNALKN